jgi:hypothetical protein
MPSRITVSIHENQLGQIDRQPLRQAAAPVIVPDCRDRGRHHAGYIGSNGRPVGYDIQQASTKTKFAAALILEQALPVAVA